jgi:hypothetical protein
MWRVYGNQGVAVQSTVGHVANVLRKTNLEFVFGQMSYVDYRSGMSVQFNPERAADFALLLRPHFFKAIRI